MVTLLQVPMTPAGVAQRKGGEQDQRHHKDGAGDVVDMPAAQERYPDLGPEEEPQKEPGEREELDEGAEPQTMDSRQQHQSDDQQVDPIHRCEGSERCPQKCGPHRYCRRAVLPRPVFHHWRVRRRSGGLYLILGAVAITASGCVFSGHPGSTKARASWVSPTAPPWRWVSRLPAGRASWGRCRVPRIGAAGPSVPPGPMPPPRAAPR